jgi:hypothetical protein
VGKETKKEKERRHLFAFWQLFADFPEGEVQHSDNPDFLVRRRSAVLGIELTGLYWPKLKGKQEPKKVFEAQDRILQRCCEMSKEIGLPPIYAQLHFRWENVSYDIESTAEKVISLIRPFVEKFAPEGMYTSEPSPVEGITRIRSCRFGGIHRCNDHRWERIYVNSLNVDPITEIQKRIDEKNEKYDDYLLKCQECWLLITADGLYFPEAFHITEKTLSHEFSCQFERFFFMNTIDNEIYELKAQRV